MQGDASGLTKQIQDVLADSDKIREGLHDDEAMPLMDWGIQQAEHIGKRLAASPTPPTDPQQISDIGFSLARLMTRVTWLVVYRKKKDAAWLTRTFQTINEMNRQLHGPDALVFSDEEITAWIAAENPGSNGDQIKALIDHLTPPAQQPTAPTPDSPPPGSPPASPPPASPPKPSLTGLAAQIAQALSPDPKPAETPPEPPQSPDLTEDSSQQGEKYD
jgi:hypothetical protein